MHGRGTRVDALLSDARECASNRLGPARRRLRCIPALECLPDHHEALVVRPNERPVGRDDASAGGLLGDDTYLTRLKALREQRDANTERTTVGLPGQRAVEWLRAIGESVRTADVPKEKADLMHAIYERITVAGPRSSVSG